MKNSLYAGKQGQCTAAINAGSDVQKHWLFFILKILKSLWSHSPAGYYTITSTEELGLPPTWIVRIGLKEMKIK
jgi:hypothetical protein